jgi:hypothetical protein
MIRVCVVFFSGVSSRTLFFYTESPLLWLCVWKLRRWRRDQAPSRRLGAGCTRAPATSWPSSRCWYSSTTWSPATGASPYPHRSFTIFSLVLVVPLQWTWHTQQQHMRRSCHKTPKWSFNTAPPARRLITTMETYPWSRGCPQKSCGVDSEMNGVMTDVCWCLILQVGDCWIE